MYRFRFGPCSGRWSPANTRWSTSLPTTLRQESPQVSYPDWLPDRHFDAAATLAHVDEVMSQVSDLLFAYQDPRNEPIGWEEVANDGSSELRVSFVRPIPPKITRLVADVFNGLRGAIEHTLFREVELLEGGSLGDAAALLVEMPAALTPEKLDEWRKSRQKRGPRTLREGTELHRRIESLQPFQCASDAGSHPLARLAAYSNLAKHRSPNLASLRIGAVLGGREPSPTLNDSPPLEDRPVHPGDVLASAPHGQRVDVDIFPTVGINLPGTAKWPVLVNELEVISEWVRKQAIPVLVTGSPQPNAELPVWFDISRSLSNPKEAIASGTTESAIARGRARLQVSIARMNLADLVTMFEGAPGRDSIAAWLSELSDGQVLELVNELGTQLVETRGNPRAAPHVVVRMFEEVRARSVRA